VACTIFEVPVGSTSVYVEQDTADKNLLGEQRLKLCLKGKKKEDRLKVLSMEMFQNRICQAYVLQM